MTITHNTALALSAYSERTVHEDQTVYRALLPRYVVARTWGLGGERLANTDRTDLAQAAASINEATLYDRQAIAHSVTRNGGTRLFSLQDAA